MAIHFTKPALSHIRLMIEKEKGAIGFRLSLKKTGCSGFTYFPEIVSLSNEKDIHLSIDNISIYLDSEYVDFLQSITVDYISDTLGRQLTQKRLVFLNPAETDRCGCGESFRWDTAHES